MGVKSGDGSGGVACGSSLSRAVAATDEAVAHELWSRLTLRAQVFHREDSPAAAKVFTTAQAAKQCDSCRFSTRNVALRVTSVLRAVLVSTRKASS